MFEKIKEKLKKGEEVVIVAFGDSITEGYGVSEGWPEKFVKILRSKFPNAKITLYNKGRAGDTLEDASYRIESDVISLNPDLVTINFGINDAFSNVNLVNFEKTLAEMIEQIKTTTESEILIITSEILEDEEADKMVRKYYDKLQKISKEKQVGFVDVHRIWHQKLREGTDLSSLLIPGLDHPNEEGYKIFAKAVAELF
ncbi:MAG: hypothetical protein OHK0040_00720 [bacterium]